MIEDEALDLPTEERAKLAARLLESLEGVPDSDVEKAWEATVRRRARELDEGVPAVTSDELEERVQAVLR